MDRAEALAKLHEWMQSPALLRHVTTVEHVMRRAAPRYGGPDADVEQWGITGLLHDADYEKWPDEHPRHVIAWLRERGVVARTGIDTRSLVLHLRDAGSAPGVAVASGLPVDEAIEHARQQPSMLGRALIEDVSTDEPYVFAEDGRVRVAVVALPMWGRSTVRGAANSRGLIAGSPS